MFTRMDVVRNVLSLLTMFGFDKEGVQGTENAGLF